MKNPIERLNCQDLHYFACSPYSCFAGNSLLPLHKKENWNGWSFLMQG